MKESIEKKFDFSEYDIDVLYAIYKNSYQAVSTEKLTEIIMAIIKKYFEDKSRINIYEFLNSASLPIAPSAKLEINLGVLNEEFKTAGNPMPVDYQEDFFKFLINSMSMLEKYLKNNGGSMEWHLSEIPTLINYLGRMDKDSIKSPSLRQKINDLVADIKEEYEKASKLRTESLQVVNVTEEKIESIPYLKLQKSKLNKKSTVDALITFGSYKDEDQVYLINLLKKKNWKDIFKNIKPVDAFDYLRRHVDTVFNMWEVFYYSISSRNYTEFAILNLWYEYFNVTSVLGLYKEMKNLYLSYDGATERGFEAYWLSVMNAFKEYRHPRVEDSNDIYDFCRVHYRLDFLRQIRDLCEYVECSMAETLVNKETKRIKMKEMPVIKADNVMEESVCEISYYISDFDRFFELFNDNNGIFFQYDGMFIENSKIEIYDDGDVLMREKIIEFIDFMNKIHFTSQDIYDLNDSSKVHVYSNHFSYYGCHYEDPSANGKLYCSETNINRFIRWSFCSNSKNLTDEFLRDIWFNNNMSKLFKLVPMISYSGFYQHNDDYSYYFFKRLQNELDFGKREDVEKLFYLYLPHSGSEKFGAAIVKKIERECPECYKILEYCAGNSLTRCLPLVYACLKSYYGIKN